MKIVIRAGGVGSRLWPMSRQNNPKQFQEIIPGKTMIRQTFERVLPAVAGVEDIFVSINEKMSGKLKDKLPEIPADNVITETDTRNTGPAMCLEICFLEDRLDEDEVIASLPSDDFISDAAAFTDLLNMSEVFIREKPDYILTPAVRPTVADTGYTYFKAGKRLWAQGEEAVFAVDDVVEKPNQDYLDGLISSGIYYAHSGMYIWRLKHVADLYRQHRPKMYEICTTVVDLLKQGKLDQARKLYSSLEKMSVESAITDKAEKIAMSVSDRVGWSDLGKWHIIKRMLLKEEEDNLTKGQVMAHRAKDNLIYSNNKKKLIVVNDLEDVVIVDTDDVLFVSSAKKSAEVKDCVKKLKEEGKDKYL